MRRFALLLTLVSGLLMWGPLVSLQAAEATAPSTEADVLRAVTQYLELRAGAALEHGDARALRRVVSGDQGLREQFIATGFRRFHEQMGDFPASSKLEVLDSSVELTGGNRATATVTVQVITGFSPESQRSCDEGVVATHTIDVRVTPNHTYSVYSDTYSPEGTTAYLTAAGAPDNMVEAAREAEESQAAAAVAAQAIPLPLTTVSGGGAEKVANTARGASDVITYNRGAVVAYAKTWWNSRNGYYNNYGGVDCANFVSQCTNAGGMMMFGARSDPESHKWYFHHSNMVDTLSWRYCPTQVNAWRWTQPGKAPGRCVVSLSSSKPSGYSKGDVAWKINGGTESHALVCTGFSGSTPLFSCHSNNHWNDPISTWTGSNEYGAVADQWIIT